MLVNIDVAREMYDDDGLSDIDALASHCRGRSIRNGTGRGSWTGDCLAGQTLRFRWGACGGWLSGHRAIAASE